LKSPFALFMNGTRRSASVLALAACFVLESAFVMQSVQAQTPSSANAPSAAPIHFALPAEPLVDAINAYGRTADIAVLVDSSALTGRMSAPLDGDFSPREALQRLLAGTGLQARFTSSDEAVIRPVPSMIVTPELPDTPSPLIFASDVAGLAAGGDDAEAYAVLLQTHLTDALCQSPLTRPGAYRLLVQLTIGSSGAVVASQLLDSTGAPARDAAIEQVMRTVSLDSAPPAGLHQPVTILLRPTGNGVSPACESPDTLD
jgi:Secretin and TonB N terminus short domain